VEIINLSLWAVLHRETMSLYIILLVPLSDSSRIGPTGPRVLGLPR
jgi:hypothetical protein